MVGLRRISPILTLATTAKNEEKLNQFYFISNY